MELRDYTIPKATIPLPGKAVNGVKPSFDVRGLCLDDMTFLVNLHLDPITRAMKLYQESRADILTSGNMTSFVMTLARDFPDLVAEVISAATDSLDDSTRKVARRLPLAAQIAALTEIVRLTLEDSGGLKNLLAEMQDKLKGLVGVESGQALPARPETK